MKKHLVKQFLVTTAIEKTWPEHPDTSILFLGEWCRLYSRKERWSRLNAEVLTYHWDDRDRLYKDCQYLSAIYEKYLAYMKNMLNHIHGCRYSKRYWRILIGPWLQYFIETLYDRYLSIIAAQRNSIITSTWIIDSDFQEWVPKDMTTFSKYLNDDGWNHFIYGEIIQLLGNIQYTVINKKICLFKNPPIIARNLALCPI